jgi:hypothetical protein
MSRSWVRLITDGAAARLDFRHSPGADGAASGTGCGLPHQPPADGGRIDIAVTALGRPGWTIEVEAIAMI